MALTFHGKRSAMVAKGLPPQQMMFAKGEPLDDHHHYRL